MLTCPVNEFINKHMRPVYPDWDEFMEWADDREWERGIAS